MNAVKAKKLLKEADEIVKEYNEAGERVVRRGKHWRLVESVVSWVVAIIAAVNFSDFPNMAGNMAKVDSESEADLLVGVVVLGAVVLALLIRSLFRTGAEIVAVAVEMKRRKMDQEQEAEVPMPRHEASWQVPDENVCKCEECKFSESWYSGAAD